MKSNAKKPTGAGMKQPVLSHFFRPSAASAAAVTTATADPGTAPSASNVPNPKRPQVDLAASESSSATEVKRQRTSPAPGAAVSPKGSSKSEVKPNVLPKPRAPAEAGSLAPVELKPEPVDGKMAESEVQMDTKIEDIGDGPKTSRARMASKSADVSPPAKRRAPPSRRSPSPAAEVLTRSGRPVRTRQRRAMLTMDSSDEDDVDGGAAGGISSADSDSDFINDSESSSGSSSDGGVGSDSDLSGAETELDPLSDLSDDGESDTGRRGRSRGGRLRRPGRGVSPPMPGLPRGDAPMTDSASLADRFAFGPAAAGPSATGPVSVPVPRRAPNSFLPPSNATAPGKGAGSKAQSKSGVNPSPLERQVMDLAARCPPGTLLAVECGYRVRFFGPDAMAASKILGILSSTPISRGGQAAGGGVLESASVPVVRIGIHVARLVGAGLKVGVVTQQESAAIKAVEAMSGGGSSSGPFERSLSHLFSRSTFTRADAGILTRSLTQASEGGGVFGTADEVAEVAATAGVGADTAGDEASGDLGSTLDGSAEGEGGLILYLAEVEQRPGVRFLSLVALSPTTGQVTCDLIPLAAAGEAPASGGDTPAGATLLASSHATGLLESRLALYRPAEIVVLASMDAAEAAAERQADPVARRLASGLWASWIGGFVNPARAGASSQRGFPVLGPRGCWPNAFSFFAGFPEDIVSGGELLKAEAETHGAPKMATVTTPAAPPRAAGAPSLAVASCLGHYISEERSKSSHVVRVERVCQSFLGDATEDALVSSARMFLAGELERANGSPLEPRLPHDLLAVPLALAVHHLQIFGQADIILDSIRPEVPTGPEVGAAADDSMAAGPAPVAAARSVAIDLPEGDALSAVSSCLGIALPRCSLSSREEGFFSLADPHDGAARLHLSADTLQQLNVLRSEDGLIRGSLLWAIDSTQTGPGARLLRTWLARPLACDRAIADRQSTVCELAGLPFPLQADEHLLSSEAEAFLQDLRSLFDPKPETRFSPIRIRAWPDLERSFSKLLSQQITVAELRVFLNALVDLDTAHERLNGAGDSPAAGPFRSGSLNRAVTILARASGVARTLRAYLSTPSASASGASSEGRSAKKPGYGGPPWAQRKPATGGPGMDSASTGLYTSGVWATLEVERQMAPQVSAIRERIFALEASLEDHLREDVAPVVQRLRKSKTAGGLAYRTLLGITHLVEVPAGARAPSDWTKLSSTKAVDRYHTPFIQESVTQLAALRAQAKIESDHAWFAFIQTISTEHSATLASVVALAARLDAWFSLARYAGSSTEVMSLPRLVSSRPTLDVRADGVSSGLAATLRQPAITFTMEQGRHPIVSKLMEEGASAKYIPNDCSLSSGGQTALVLTGPNMGGKSSYARSCASIALLSHVGCHVPAASVTCSVLVGGIHTRIGAQDDLVRGRSTFLMEMREASEILAATAPIGLVESGSISPSAFGQIMSMYDCRCQECLLVEGPEQASLHAAATAASEGTELPAPRSLAALPAGSTVAAGRPFVRPAFVLMDELGRGTATYDGAAVAEAVLQELVNVCSALTIFITHYPSLTRLAPFSGGRIANAHMMYLLSGGAAAGTGSSSSSNSQPAITFLHQVTVSSPSPSQDSGNFVGNEEQDHSYGLNVARLAQLPEALVLRAGEMASSMRRSVTRGRAAAGLHQLLRALANSTGPDDAAVVALLADFRQAMDRSGLRAEDLVN
ncbi:hypothetical protein H696_05037 [Fonticula alba]|uniref:DNA mismatch repair proteins mutS family domain-containing protein n=1 Tax=Fonticula alba TaxID=691883 RepID=A0A058Z5E0_FONAL|nr:hypothetical protein H696_05037 [Fonticula alba]KCV68752.1 hypothetical protein H696_05037 [Fonticula alba]|eukprot:XP_009497184.1 hypothetical protein H696_05037 [Fonticula alba]